jgi:glycosyltransferase involved in cell wall biosynthesis
MARRVLRLGERLGVEFSNARIVISSVIARSIERQFDRDSVLIPNGVVPGAPTLATDVLDRLGLQPGRYFLHVGRMVPEKRQLDLIRAYVMAAVPGWKLVLVGGLDSSDYCRRVQTAASQSGAVLTGFVKGRALDQLYSHAGGFVLPSTHEGLPIALLEALGFGLPTVASDIPANLEVALDASSYFHVGNLDSLTAALQRMAADPPDAAGRAERRRQIAERYDWDRIAAQTMDVYRRVLREP